MTIAFSSTLSSFVISISFIFLTFYVVLSAGKIYLYFLIFFFFYFLCFYELGRKTTSPEFEGLLLCMFIPCIVYVYLAPLLAVWSCGWNGLGVPGPSVWDLLVRWQELKLAWAREFLGFFAQGAPWQES